MAKVKIFSSSNVEILERTINDFLVDKKLIDIKHTPLLVPKSYAGSIVSSYDIYDRVLITYEDQVDG